MALIPEVVAAVTGGTPAGRAPANGDTIVPSDKTMLVVTNSSGGSITVTVVGAQPCNQGGLHDSVTTVPAAGTRIIGPIDKRYANNSNGGLAVVNYSATASVSVYTTRV